MREVFQFVENIKQLPLDTIDVIIDKSFVAYGDGILWFFRNSFSKDQNAPSVSHPALQGAEAIHCQWTAAWETILVF